MAIWSMSWFSIRDGLIVDEMVIAILSNGLCRVAKLMDPSMDWVDQIHDDTSEWIETVLTTVSMYRDYWDRWDVQMRPKCLWCWWWPCPKNTFLIERESWVLCNFEIYSYCNFIILFCTSYMRSYWCNDSCKPLKESRQTLGKFRIKI